MVNNNAGLGFFKDAESFLTELSDLESEYVRGGGKSYSKSNSKSKSRSKSKT